MKNLRLLSLALAALAAPALLHAQGGCVNSPENPTSILALIGIAGAAVTTFRARRRN
jgi:XrtJ-associated TM-motif-TM protein